MLQSAIGLRSLSPGQGSIVHTKSPAMYVNIWRRALSSTSKAQKTMTGQRSGLLRHLCWPRNVNHPFTSRPGLTFSRSPRREFCFSGWRRNATQNGTQQKLTLSQRLKRLSKEYGWSAVGVYLALSVLDFPFCFLLVRTVGTDTIGKIEHYVVSSVSQLIPDAIRQKWVDYRHFVEKAEADTLGKDAISDKVEMAGWGVKEAEQHHKEEASLGTQLALAYAIHKSFIFFRVPLTAAVTPKVVKVLRSWGWNIGKRNSR